jgi:Family of unknown function (DUF6585)
MENIRIPETFQSVIGLGRPKQVFRAGCANIASTVASAAIIGFFAVVMVVLAIASALEKDANFFVSFCLVGLGVAGGVYIAIQFFRSLRALRTAAVLYDGGFALSSGGEPPTIIAWNDVQQLTAKITQTNMYGFIRVSRECKYTIDIGPKGSVVIQTPMGGVEKLYQAIRENAMPRIVASLHSQFQEGRTLDFGPVSVSKADGIHTKNRTIPWSSIRSIQMENGAFKVTPKSGGMFGSVWILAGSIPNLDALLVICQEAAKTQTP